MYSFSVVNSVRSDQIIKNIANEPAVTLKSNVSISSNLSTLPRYAPSRPFVCLESLEEAEIENMAKCDISRTPALHKNDFMGLF